METVDIEAVRAQAAVIMRGIMAGENLDLVISGAMLLAITALSLTYIWRNRAPAPPTAATPAAAGGMLRWLTPNGSQNVAAEQAAMATRPKRNSGSHKTMKVITPVSKVSQRALKAGATPLELARKSGLSRDGVAMMMAAAAPKSAARPAIAAAAQPAPAARTAGSPNEGRAMMAPGAYTQAQRVIPPKTERPGVGTRFNARVS
jgi:hypothetical protein